MALQFELESLDGIDEALQGLYEEKDGKYRLLLDGLEDTGALKRAKDHEKQARKDAEDRAKALQAQLDDFQKQVTEREDEASRKKGDIDALEQSWRDKLAKREKELMTQIESQNAAIQRVLVDKEAVRLASELAIPGSADIVVPHIKTRLGVDEKDGQLVTVVLDSNGRPSALTLDELKQEFSNNKAFAPIIAGSQASGGGAESTSKGGGASQAGGDLSKMSREQKLEYFRQKRGT